MGAVRPHPAGSWRRLRAVVASRVRDRVDAAELGSFSPSERRLRVREEAIRILGEHRVVLPVRDLTSLINEVSDEVVGLGPIEFLLKDPEVSEDLLSIGTLPGWVSGSPLWLSQVDSRIPLDESREPARNLCWR